MEKFFLFLFYRLLVLKKERNNFLIRENNFGCFRKNMLRGWFRRRSGLELEFSCGILHYGIDFHPSTGQQKKTTGSNLTGQWGKSGRVPTTYTRKLRRGKKEGNDRAFGKLADENESSIGHALHCSWQLVGSSRRGRRISLRWKGTSRGRGEEKRRNKRGKIHAAVNVRVSIGELREEREQKRGGKEQRPIDRETSK